MREITSITGDQLVDALYVLGINFVLGGDHKADRLHIKPVRLIAALAGSSEARLRLSLIPLFLDHPELAIYVQRAQRGLDPSARLTLQCYYTAAVWLRLKYQAQRARLPDYFSRELNLNPGIDPDENLRSLARRHADLSGAQVNWLGTYQHAAQIWMRGKELNRG